MGKEYIQVKNMIFPGKNPNLNSVEKYITDNISGQIIVSETGDIIQIGSKFKGIYLHDLINIKKEASTPFES